MSDFRRPASEILADISILARERSGVANGQAQGFIVPNPTIIERTGRGERHYDVWSRLLEDRIVYLGTPINDTVANMLIGQLLVLAKTDRTRDVHLYINSPGGSISAGLAVYDTMQYISCPVETVCIGSAASMAAILLAAGTPGKRYALPNSRIMIHQPWGGAQGTAADIEIQAEEILKMRTILNDILARHTGRPLEQIEDDTDRDKYLAAADAREYGLIDEVIESTKVLGDEGSAPEGSAPEGSAPEGSAPEGSASEEGRASSDSGAGDA